MAGDAAKGLTTESPALQGGDGRVRVVRFAFLTVLSDERLSVGAAGDGDRSAHDPEPRDGQGWAAGPARDRIPTTGRC